MSASQQPSSLLFRILRHIPILGFALSCFAEEEPPRVTILFMVNCVLAWILAILIWGYAALIIPALYMAAFMGLLVIGLTRG